MTPRQPRWRQRGRIRRGVGMLLLLCTTTTLASSINNRLFCCCNGLTSHRASGRGHRTPSPAFSFLLPSTSPTTADARHQPRSRPRPKTHLAASPHNTPPPPPAPPVGRRALLLALPGAGVYLATSAAAGFALEGSVERTLAAAVVACVGLAGAAYGPTLLGEPPGRGQQKAGEVEEGFSAFQRSYLAVQLLATFIDFVQGPYLFKVYAGTYGLATNDIALLYLVGFGASALASPFVGPFADTYGRRLGCMAFAALQAASCVLLHLGQSLSLLAAGRLLSGLATAFLATCFEAWMVAEHRRRAFASLIPTFALQALCLGPTAVAAGGAADAVVDATGGSYLAPFDLCAAAAGLELLLIPWLWRTENRGVIMAVAPVGAAGKVMERRGNGMADGLWAAAKEGLAVFGAGRREVLWLGLTQICFEVALFTFVFLWTPALEAPGGPAIPGLNLGLVFATLMVGVTAGGAAFRLLVGEGEGEGEGESDGVGDRLRSEEVLTGALALAVGSLGAASLPGIRGDALLLAFVLYEAAFGLYTGAIGDLRARLLPEASRATVMNQVRLLLNALVVGVYLGPLRLDADMGAVKRPLVLGLCTALCLLAAAAHARLRAALSMAGGGEEEEDDGD